MAHCRKGASIVFKSKRKEGGEMAKTQIQVTSREHRHTHRPVRQNIRITRRDAAVSIPS